MAAIAKERALQIARDHAASVPLDHPDYRLGFDLSGRIGDEWLFAYRIECLKDIPPEQRERFAGAGGFVVSAEGQVRELSVPMYMEAERKVGAHWDTIAIDLSSVRSTTQLMDVFGEALELGGPHGNVQVQGPADGRGWGKNWNALLDSLTCLDTGGIWGTSRKLRFPLRLELKNSSGYRAADPEGFATLIDVLEDAREQNAESDLEFAYRFELDA